MKNMSIQTAKYLEYSIFMVHEIAGMSNSAFYKVIWKTEDGVLIAGNFFDWQNNKPAITWLNSTFEENIDRTNVVAPYSFQDFRAKFFNQFPNFGNWESFYEHPADLLYNLSSFVQKLHPEMTLKGHPKRNFDGPVKLNNVEILESNRKLDFLLLDPEEKVQPVSLISASKN